MDEHERPRRQQVKHVRAGHAVPVAVAAEIAPATRGPLPLEILEKARDVMTVRRVFGEPIHEDGVTVIPVASVRGGGGGGGDAVGSGGGGFGVVATPAGAYVIKDGEVRWRPAIDVNRTILGGQIVAIVALLTLRSLVKALARGRRS